MRVDVLETPELGDRSYVVSDGTCAVVVDPQRDLDRVESVLAELGVPVTLVLETHLHNDYVTGGHALAQRSGATYVVSGHDKVAFSRCSAHDGDVFPAGSMSVRTLATPGHTDTHLSYVITDDSGDPPAVFTGGSLLFGSVGRTDLLGSDRTLELTRQQWRSARRLAHELPDETRIYPTHGFGSFCSSGGASGASESTVGQEKQGNDALRGDDEDDFVEHLIAGLTGYPAYYVHMGPRNAAGPDAADLTPPRQVDRTELARRVRGGEWVIDLRDRALYAGAHLAGTVSIGVGKQFSTYVGWVVPWEAPLTLIGDTFDQVAEAQRQLVRIGIDSLAGSATGPIDELAEDVSVRGYERASFEQLAAAGDVQVLDVRRDDEVAGGRLAGSIHIPLQALTERMAEVPAGPVWVHCASGFRASIAASLLDRAGHPVVHVDDDYDNAAKAGLQVTG